MWAIGGVVLGCILTGLITYLSQRNEKPVQVFPIIYQKTQTVHDTIYIANPKTSRDTSLVRLVNRPNSATLTPHTGGKGADGKK